MWRARSERLLKFLSQFSQRCVLGPPASLSVLLLAAGAAVLLEAAAAFGAAARLREDRGGASALAAGGEESRGADAVGFDFSSSCSLMPGGGPDGPNVVAGAKCELSPKPSKWPGTRSNAGGAEAPSRSPGVPVLYEYAG